MIINITGTDERVISAIINFGYKKRLINGISLLILFVLTFITYLLVWLDAIDINDNAYKDFIFFNIVFSGIFILFETYYIIQICHRIRKLKKGLSEPYDTKYIFYENEFNVSFENHYQKFNTTLSYSTLYRVVEYIDYFAILLNKHQVFFIDKNRFENQTDIAALTEMFMENNIKIRRKFKKLSKD